MSESQNKIKIKLFEERHVRAIWDEEAEKWWFPFWILLLF